MTLPTGGQGAFSVLGAYGRPGAAVQRRPRSFLRFGGNMAPDPDAADPSAGRVGPESGSARVLVLGPPRAH